MRFICVTFDGGIFPVAYQLEREGNRVWMCQIENGDELSVKSWITDKEDTERRRRRLSLYDGMIKKHGLKETYAMAKNIKDKDNVAVIVDHNTLYEVSMEFQKMGFTKLFPNLQKEDFDREKERQKSKDFVKKHYPNVVVDEVKVMSNADEVIKFIQESDQLWCVKSDGNFAETVVPDKDDIEMGKLEVISEIERQKEDFNKGKIILEPKIIGACEITPAMYFWDGKPIYSQCEFETRMFGAEDIGPQTGGNEDIVYNTKLDCPINKIAFPQAAKDLAKGRKGLFIIDAGLLYDGKQFHFMEYAGNRWGWGGIFSEIAGTRDTDKWATQYFTEISKGKNPFRYKFGASLAFYNMKTDKKKAELAREGLPINIKEGSEDYFSLMQVKEERGKLVNVGYRLYDDGPLGYATCYGNTIEEAAQGIYEYLDGFSFKGLYYRPYSDFVSPSYLTSLVARYNKTKKFLN